MNKRYLIFECYVHAVIFFVQAQTTEEAMWYYISEMNDNAQLNADGSISDGSNHYSCPLAYIEASGKTLGEWQIRELPDWVWTDKYNELFCGESKDGPASDITDCRPYFAQAFPRSRAKAFVWYLKQGHLVSFYRRRGPFNIQVLKRYLVSWDENKTTVEEWKGDCEQIMQSLSLVPYRSHPPKQREVNYPFRSVEEFVKEPYGKGSKIVVLTPDVAAKFPDSESVNNTLRELSTISPPHKPAK